MTTHQKLRKVGWDMARMCCILIGSSASGVYAQTCSTNRVSLDANGQEIPTDSVLGEIAPYGRFVTFTTTAALLPSDTNNGQSDVYLVDTTTGSLELISMTYQGTSGNLQSYGQADFSDDARMVAFRSQAGNMVPGLSPWISYHAFVRDRVLGQTRLISVSSPAPRSGRSTGVVIPASPRRTMQV